MSQVDLIAVIDGADDGLQICYQRYLRKIRDRTKTLLPGNVAVDDFSVFESSLENLLDKIRTFLATSLKNRAFLVLGKIQSGKTAHLLGTLAWAVNSPISFAVIFTGVTGALNSQTVERVNRDIGGLGDQYVKVLTVPTRATGRQYAALKSEMELLLGWRLEEVRVEGRSTPLPVLITLKNPQRIGTLRVLLGDLESKYGGVLTTLLIDDEADQASQNAGAQRRVVARTYRAIASLREGMSRNIMLSYTATPQAVLLAERNGFLRPDECAIVSPRMGYFGLSRVIDENFATNRIEVNDWPGNSAGMPRCPESLQNAIVDFFCIAWLRNHRPSEFYGQRLSSDDNLNLRMKSVQMMIHESSRQLDHSRIYELVNDFRKGLCVKVFDALSEANSPIRGELISRISDSFTRLAVSANNGTAPNISVTVDDELLSTYFVLLNACQILVVNSASDRPGADIHLPVRDDEWDLHKTWILIGGDILGRGLTIPQLVVTYFMRTAHKPNFDTVSQQMRFCGYRADYSRFVRLFAPMATFDSFIYMNLVDDIVWKRAGVWDAKSIDLKKHIPNIMYATPTGFIMEPTRNAVRDPDLRDTRITGEVIFSGREIMDPLDTKFNLQVVDSWLDDQTSVPEQRDGWLIFEHVENIQLQRLIGTWNAGDQDLFRMRSAVELFEEEMGTLGLGSLPKVVCIHKSLLPGALLDNLAVQDFLNSTEIYRRLNAVPTDLSRNKWIESVVEGIRTMDPWPSLAVGHVGDSQRSLRSSFAYDAVVAVIEPILGTKDPRDRTSAVAAGIGFTLFSPNEYEIRILGHE